MPQVSESGRLCIQTAPTPPPPPHRRAAERPKAFEVASDARLRDASGATDLHQIKLAVDRKLVDLRAVDREKLSGLSDGAKGDFIRHHRIPLSRDHDACEPRATRRCSE